jgi:DnaJ-class molecular chaperone
LQKEIVAKGTELTLDELYSRLLAGETFKLERALAPASCKDCNGFGKVPDKSGGYRKGDGKVPCSTCRGHGKIIPIQPLVVRW